MVQHQPPSLPHHSAPYHASAQPRMGQIQLDFLEGNPTIQTNPAFPKTSKWKTLRLKIRRPGSACTVILILCSIQKMSAKTPPNQNPKSEIQNPKSEIRNPKSKIQNPKSKIQNPKSKIQNLHKKNCYIRLQNPKSEIQNPKSEIQNPKSKIRNPKFRKFGAVGASSKGMLHNDPKSKIQNPRNPAEKVWILDFGLGNFGFGIPDFGFWGGPGDVPLGNSVTVP